MCMNCICEKRINDDDDDDEDDDVKDSKNKFTDFDMSCRSSSKLNQLFLVLTPNLLKISQKFVYSVVK